MDEIKHSKAGIPTRMGPLVLFATVGTHLFGGSAGREGTAVQIGGATSNWLAQLFKLDVLDRKVILMAGVAAGFGSIFGTPLTGAIFAVEVAVIGRIRLDALMPALFASILADYVTSVIGPHLVLIGLGAVHHTHYGIGFEHLNELFGSHVKLDLILALKILVAGMIFGIAGYLFSELVPFFKSFYALFSKNPYVIVVIGGLIIIAAVKLVFGHMDYVGLGVYATREGGVSILQAFNGNVEWYSWIAKLLLTTLTLAAGFKGGEVTPLFFIGATLGAYLAHLLGVPVDLLAGLGFIAVFAAATNTPFACMIMGVELFGSEHILYFALVTFTAYYFSGHTSIYSSQRIAVHKSIHGFTDHDEEKKMGSLRGTEQKSFIQRFVEMLERLIEKIKRK